jgi:hypothetical protein
LDVSALSQSKRMHGRNDGGDVGHAEEKDHAPLGETRKVEEDAAGLVRQRVAAEDAAINADAAAKAGPVRTEEAIIKEVTATEVIAPHIVIDGTAVGEVAAAEASSGQGEPCKTVEEAMEEASAGIGH